MKDIERKIELIENSTSRMRRAFNRLKKQQVSFADFQHFMRTEIDLYKNRLIELGKLLKIIDDDGGT